MKLPKWLLWSMVSLSVATVLAAAGWWWVSWPERTARAYFDLLQQARWREAATMLTPPTIFVETGENESDNEHFAPAEYWRSGMKTAEFMGGSERAIADLLLGRQDFLMVHHEWIEEGFTVERGAILWQQTKRP